MAEDTQIGYPPVRLMSPPEVQRRHGLVGMGAAIRAGAEVQALACHRRPWLEYRQGLKQGLTRAPSKRDAPFGDHRAAPREETG